MKKHHLKPNIKAFTIALTPVSYTHLDVYKRQTPLIKKRLAIPPLSA